MGQRIIISESERSYIRKLYESESAPPPDEYVVVAIKNPFKDDEYVSARRGYSSYLKDGDLFTALTYKSVNGLDARNFILNILKEKLSGKSVRISDKILVFGRQIEISNIRVSPFEKVLTSNSFIEDVTLKSYEFQSIFDPYNYEVNFDLLDNEFWYRERKWSYGTTYTIGGMVRKKPTGWSEKLITTFKDFSSKIITELPDEYFEIREIRRRQTDF